MGPGPPRAGTGPGAAALLAALGIAACPAAGFAQDAAAPDASASAGPPAAWADPYVAAREALQKDLALQLSMPVSVFAQTGTPHGGPPVVTLVYTPSIAWTAFNDARIGSGTFSFSFQQWQFWTGANTAAQQARMGLLASPNDWTTNGYQFAQLNYTQKLPGNTLAVTLGQYSFGGFDLNQYAGDAQFTFLNVALAQNATQAYTSGSIGAYAQVAPDGPLSLAAGFQGASDVSGESVTARGLGNGRIAWFANATYKPGWLKGGAYSLLWYVQPSVPAQPSPIPIQGISFSASQDITRAVGVFLRVNNASGPVLPIETSIAGGFVWNDPAGREKADQAGFGLAWNKTNRAYVRGPARAAEWVFEAYYRFAVHALLQITPGLQLYANPVLAPSTSLAALFALRATVGF
ncbi:MAG: carbohydrate porin [Proteobacteria bacterium]|nr:carbohydrate porin [Pseudomonadota bacterium]